MASAFSPPPPAAPQNNHTSARNSTSSRKSLVVGDRVHAKWTQNGSYYPAVIRELKGGEVVVDWDDGDTVDRVIALSDVSKIEDARPYPRHQIEDAAFVQDLPNKGRCLFTRYALRSGEVIFCEAATLVAIESRHQGLWDALKSLHEEEQFELGTWTFAYAALLSLLELGSSDLQVVQDKFVPDEEKEVVGADVHRIFNKLGFPQNFVAVKSVMPADTSAVFPSGKKFTKTLLQTLINAWRYNSFGHHTEDGLVLYNRISMCAHSCDPSCCWTYGDDDSFVLRARVALEAGSELTISYLQDEDLLKSTDVRREKLENWKFTCGCTRCNLKVDVSRGYRCLRCRAGAHYYKENYNPSETEQIRKQYTKNEEEMRFQATSSSSSPKCKNVNLQEKEKDHKLFTWNVPRVKTAVGESTNFTGFGRQSQQLLYQDVCSESTRSASSSSSSSSASSSSALLHGRIVGSDPAGKRQNPSAASPTARSKSGQKSPVKISRTDKSPGGTSGSSNRRSSGVREKDASNGRKSASPGRGGGLLREAETNDMNDEPKSLSPASKKAKIRPSERLTACDVCGEPCTDFAAEQCLSLEPEYVQRIEQLDKTNIQDMELVYNATLDFFHENHWCVFQCEQLLGEYYTETRKDLGASMLHQRNRISYHERTFGRPSFIWAGDLEALADNLQSMAQPETGGTKSGGSSPSAGGASSPSRGSSANPLKSGNSSSQSSPADKGKNNRERLSRLSECLTLYRKAQSQFAILCGPSHPYSLATQNKWHSVQHRINALAAQHAAKKADGVPG
ncbi:unnamed protein product [Amoebophrya sp. A120]|nr:unnamed protein product [Amoebophrya sp. A120]|eukprot:GSA120T00011120001.1